MHGKESDANQYKNRGLKEVDICRAPMDLSKGCDMWGTRAG